MLTTVVTTFFFPKFRYSIENLLPQQTASCRDICGNYVCEVNDHKPIIYLYPPKTTEVSVKLGNPQNLTHTYPKYEEDGWKVNESVLDKIDFHNLLTQKVESTEKEESTESK